jgi:3-deoxy-D-manno-octulosonic-acid transferase
MVFSPVLGLWLLLASRRGAAREAALRRAAGAPDADARLGEPAVPRPAGPLVWLHAGEGTEQAALDELVRRLRENRPEVTVLMTRADRGDPVPGGPGRALRMRGIIFQPAPLDTARVAAAFLGHWRPDVAVRTGLSLAPATLAALDRRRTPVLMIDLHLPIRASRLVWRVPRLARSLLRGVHRLLAADDLTAQFLRRHGAPSGRIEVLGHLPDSTGALPCNDHERAALAARIGARPVWLALAPSAAELPLVLAAHRQAMRRTHRLLLILAPPDAPDAAAALAEAGGFSVARQSSDEDPDPATEVWVTEGIAERGLLYRLSPLTFLGQTIDPGPAAEGVAAPEISPYEPAALGSAILHGARTGAYAAAYGKMMRAGATLPVRSAAELAQAVEILQAPDRVAALAHAAWDVASSGAEVADRVIDLVVAALDAREVAA